MAQSWPWNSQLTVKEKKKKLVGILSIPEVLRDQEKKYFKKDFHMRLTIRSHMEISK